MVQVVKLPRFRKDGVKLDFSTIFRTENLLFLAKKIGYFGIKISYLDQKSMILESMPTIFDPKQWFLNGNLCTFRPKSVFLVRNRRFLTRSSDFSIEIYYFWSKMVIFGRNFTYLGHCKISILTREVPNYRSQRKWHT